MAATLISTRSVVDAVMNHLAAATSPSIPAYLSEGPTPPVSPSVVVHPLAGSYFGTLGDHTQDLLVSFQTTSIGERPAQALWMHDIVSSRLWKSVLAVVTGVTTLPVHAVEGSQRPVQRDDTLAKPMFYLTCGWEVRAIPT